MFSNSFFAFLLFISAFHFSSHAQYYYKGIVTDENGNPLSYANIYIPGSYGRGTVSDKDGSFQIEAKPHQTLNFYYTGKKEYFLQLNEKDTTGICIVMKPKINRLDEITIRKQVVITEYIEDDCIYIDDRDIFQLVAEDPKFPGGMDSLKSYLYHSLKYPEQSFINGEEGQVWVQFTINSKGKSSKLQIKRSVSPALDAEALRIIREMPTWKPGNNRGRAVDCQFILPINFYIHKNYRQVIKRDSSAL